MATIAVGGKGLCAVFEQKELMPLRECDDAIHFHAAAKQMSDDNCAGVRGDGAFEHVGPHGAGRRIKIERHRDEAVMFDDADHIADGDGGDENLTALRQRQLLQHQIETAAH